MWGPLFVTPALPPRATEHSLEGLAPKPAVWRGHSGPELRTIFGLFPPIRNPLWGLAPALSCFPELPRRSARPWQPLAQLTMRRVDSPPTSNQKR